MDALAEAMPATRKKEEVPKWFVLAANLSLKLHLENSFYAFERVVRCGGLLSALPPEIASKHLAPQTQQILLECRGFNDKNHYQRTTPCDQDFLRKFVREVPAADWQAWFNGPVQRAFQRDGFFDPAGIFIGDGSYLFVPDNPEYEGSAVMWFDEHNHPVKYEELSPQERKKAHRERCYKLVSLLHLRGDCYVYAGLAVVPGNAHECPVLYELVEQFVKQVGPPSREQYGRRTKIEERHRLLKCFHDLSDFHSRCFNVIAAQVVFILLSYTLRQWQLGKFRQQDLAGKTPGLLGRQLNLHSEHVVIYYQNAYTRRPLLTFSRELLELPAQARARALKRLRHLEQSFLTPLENLRVPP